MAKPPPVDIKPKKPIITPEERAKQKLANTLFAGSKQTKEVPKAQGATVNPPKKEATGKNFDSLI